MEDEEEIDLSKLTERQQIALLLKQSEEEAKKPSSSGRKKPPSTPRSRRDEIRPAPSGARKLEPCEQFATDGQQGPKEGLWTPREHAAFMDVVDAHQGAEIKWSTVAEQIGGRTEHQCAEYMQLLISRGLLTHGPPPAAKTARDPQEEPVNEPQPKRARANVQTRRQSSALPTYRRVRSDEIPALLPKIPQDKIQQLARSLVKKLEDHDERLAQAWSEADPPELVNQEPAPSEQMETVDVSVNQEGVVESLEGHGLDLSLIHI
eukprot:TRINITY_DN61119_c0_g1_i1.p1 TRINITY_DN61119_c0_g1~~TRINITY_DN61119_c0_g1_i1.p1  ORF type:complete len:263 (+),score=53.37 TRINITY_DN61119_c0_g1_i1:207-995(+)